MLSTYPFRLFAYACLLLAYFQGSLFAEDTGNRYMDILDDQRTLEIGDRLTYQVIEERESPIIVFVNARGQVDVPLIGTVSATQKTPQALAFEIKSLLEVDYFHRATVILRFPQQSASRGTVDIAGAVREPRSYALPSDQILTVSSAIALAGGLTADSDGSAVTLVRRSSDESTSESRQVVDIRGIMDSGDFDQDPAIQDGDLIIVPRLALTSGGTIYVVGGVNSPGILNVPPGDTLTVSKAILQSGGFSRFARKNTVKLISGDSSIPEDERTQIVNVEEILQRGLRDNDPIVKPNDIIRVEERIIAF